MSDDNTLWVGGLAEEVTEDLLFELFLQAGPLEKVFRPKEKDGTPKRFAFVEFVHPESVPYAIQVMEGIRLYGQNLRLKARTGSQHDANVHSSSPGQNMNLYSDYSSSPQAHNFPGSRNGPEFQRSRSYHGQEQMKRGPPSGPSPLAMAGNGHFKPAPQRSVSGGEDGQSFNGPGNPLIQPLSVMGPMAPHMQPQNMAGRRDRVLRQQAISFQAHSAMNAHNPYGGYNYEQTLGGYGHSLRQQQPQPWNPNQPHRQQFF